MSRPAGGPLTGRTVGITADRRWEEQAALFTRRGAAIVHGPTLRTVDASGDEQLRRATTELIARPPDLVVATTGMGFRMWLAAAAEWGQGEALLAGLSRARIVARGAKSASAVKGVGLEVAWQAPGERMTEVVDFLAAEAGPEARIALQLFDRDDASTAALAARHAGLVTVPVYRWQLPHDLGPAQRLVAATAKAELDAVTFTAQPAVHHLFRIAEPLGLADALRRAFAGAVLAVCVGPVCAEALHDEGVAEAIWPEPARLPAMVRLTAERLGAA